LNPPPYETDSTKTRAAGEIKLSTPKRRLVNFRGKRDAKGLERASSRRMHSKHFDLKPDPPRPEFQPRSACGSQQGRPARYSCPPQRT